MFTENSQHKWSQLPNKKQTNTQANKQTNKNVFMINMSSKKRIITHDIMSFTVIIDINWMIAKYKIMWPEKSVHLSSLQAQ